jgi:hypothetical protein
MYFSPYVPCVPGLSDFKVGLARAVRSLYGPPHSQPGQGKCGRELHLDLSPPPSAPQGLVLHARDFISSAPLRGKRVVVVGSGKSAHDCSVVAASEAAGEPTQDVALGKKAGLVRVGRPALRSQPAARGRRAALRVC